MEVIKSEILSSRATCDKRLYEINNNILCSNVLVYMESMCYMAKERDIHIDLFILFDLGNLEVGINGYCSEDARDRDNVLVCGFFNVIGDTHFAYDLGNNIDISAHKKGNSLQINISGNLYQPITFIIRNYSNVQSIILDDKIIKKSLCLEDIKTNTYFNCDNDLLIKINYEKIQDARLLEIKNDI